MKLSAKLLALTLLAVPAVPALGGAAGPASAAVTTGPTMVARYTFDAATAGARISDSSGRGPRLTVRAVSGGTVRFPAAASGGRYATFPAYCNAAAGSCPRAFLEGTDDADLDPGTRQFRYGATVYVKKSQVHGSSNVMQKGVVSTESQWKLQIGENLGKAQCVVVGRGSTRTYLARSDSTVSDGRWHRLMCVRTATRLTVYVDGHNRGHVSLPAGLTISNALPLRIGGPNFAAGSDMYHGALDDVYVALG